MYEALRVFLALALTLFMPGVLIVLLFFREMRLLEKVLLGIGISIMITISMTIYFAYDKTQQQASGGLSMENMLIAYFVVMLSCISLYICKLILKKVFKKKINTQTYVKKTS